MESTRIVSGGSGSIRRVAVAACYVGFGWLHAGYLGST